MTRREWLGLGASFVLCFGAAAIGALFTPGAWYEQLAKPTWTPPSGVFGPVWTILYGMMAVAAWLVWKERGFSRARVPLGLFALQLVLNAAWSWLFFGLQRPGLAMVEITLLWAAILATILAFRRVRPLAGFLLAPYLIWVTFAGALNFEIWRLNASPSAVPGDASVPPAGDSAAPPAPEGTESTLSVDLRVALQRLLRGPASQPEPAARQSWFSAATADALRSATVDSSGRATVDFHDLRAIIPNASSSAGSALLLEELNSTVFTVPGIRSVEYRMEGSCDLFWEWLQYACHEVVRDSMLQVEVRIDGVAEDLVPIGLMLVATDGTMIVTQQQDAAIRFFDVDGESMGSFGRSGEGPGEFRSLARIGWYHDTLWAFDSQLARFTLISTDRRLARSVLAPMQARPALADSGRIPEFPIAIPIGMLPEGGYHALLSIAINQDVPERFRNASVYGVITEDGVVDRIIAFVASDPDCCIRADGPRGTSTASVPFTNRSRYVPSSDGKLGVRAAEVPADDGAAIAVTVFTTDGATVFARRYPVTRVAIAPSVRDSISRSRIAQLEQASPDLADVFRRQARIPEFYPAVANLLVGRDGSVWIEEPTADENRLYLALSPTGEPLGRLRLPGNSRIAVAEQSRIWVLERDHDDVQSVVRYGVRW